ncbi:heme-binding beta-barrel domain-containing protein [Vogesella amnigena]|uniref:Heme-binding beta-barrel domain-containing protein n=1 Tax=Vogesella amnigena TaxID=1507449 RepID=A0ABV7TTP5_9NEIS
MQKLLAIGMLCMQLVTAHAATISGNPLSPFLGSWEGNKGMDIAPSQKKTGLPPGSSANNAYFEKIVFSEGADATNASEQDVVAIKYHQQVFRKTDNKKFHDQIGYWIWDKRNNTIIHAFCVPRGTCVSAQGLLKQPRSLEVATDTAFAESAFMRKQAKTNRFSMTMKLNDDGTLTYSQITQLQIYGKPFTHVDANTQRKTGN